MKGTDRGFGKGANLGGMRGRNGDAKRGRWHRLITSGTTTQRRRQRSFMVLKSAHIDGKTEKMPTGWCQIENERKGVK